MKFLSHVAILLSFGLVPKPVLAEPTEYCYDLQPIESSLECLDSELDNIHQNNHKYLQKLNNHHQATIYKEWDELSKNICDLMTIHSSGQESNKNGYHLEQTLCHLDLENSFAQILKNRKTSDGIAAPNNIALPIIKKLIVYSLPIVAERINTHSEFKSHDLEKIFSKIWTGFEKLSNQLCVAETACLNLIQNLLIEANKKIFKQISFSSLELEFFGNNALIDKISVENSLDEILNIVRQNPKEYEEWESQDIQGYNQHLRKLNYEMIGFIKILNEYDFQSEHFDYAETLTKWAEANECTSDQDHDHCQLQLELSSNVWLRVKLLSIMKLVYPKVGLTDSYIPRD
ncbi:hypothetical protein [Taylorella equigenitalis]|uniref:hypothetical protein n=1 Tax=Taylorella equigenitalis TaxID=29575 RepID=UPI000420B4E7|nr:hypothetical protein [Taylorella equigenitalis]ASY41444.1 hypothetical protein CAV20_07275 [Taylorella equigenitalis]